MKSRIVVNIGTGLASLGALLAACVLLASQASAATYNWHRHVSGSHAHGHIWRSNGYLHNRWTIKDTRADGHCAYVQMRALTLNGTPWGDVWLHGRTHRHEVCGHGHHKSGKDNWSIDGSSGPTTKKIRLEARACRDIKHAFDHCSNWYVSGAWKA